MAEKDISSHCEDCHNSYSEVDQTNYENQAKLKHYLGRVEVYIININEVSTKNLKNWAKDWEKSKLRTINWESRMDNYKVNWNPRPHCNLR